MGEKHRKLYIIKCKVCGNRKRRAVPYALYCSEKCAHHAQRRNRAKREADQVNTARAAREAAEMRAEQEAKRLAQETMEVRRKADAKQLAQELDLWIPRCQCGAQDWRLTWWQSHEGHGKTFSQYTMICRKCGKHKPALFETEPCPRCVARWDHVRQEFYLDDKGTLTCAAGMCKYERGWRHWKVIPVIVKRRSLLERLVRR